MFISFKKSSLFLTASAVATLLACSPHSKAGEKHDHMHLVDQDVDAIYASWAASDEADAPAAADSMASLRSEQLDDDLFDAIALGVEYKTDVKDRFFE